MSFAMQIGSVSFDSKAESAKGGDLSTFVQVTFQTPFPQGSQVIVVPMVQTFNGGQTPGLRIAEVTNTGFKIRMNEVTGKGLPNNGGPHKTEEIGWIAVTR